LTDRQAADAVRGRIDWKYALGLELTDPGFDHTVLTGFRQRLIDHGLEETLLDVLLARLSELGLVKAGGRQRTDSTHVLAAVRSANRLEFLAETLRASLEALAAAAPDWLATRIDAEWVTRYAARMDGAVALSHRAISTPQIFRHQAEDRRQDSHQSSNIAGNRAALSWSYRPS
jgi:IS5 family transposase